MSAEKSIDGMSLRPATASRVAKIKPAKLATSNILTSRKKSVKKVAASDSEDPLKQKVTQKKATAKDSKAIKRLALKRSKQLTANAHADFLKPVESFDFDLTSEDISSAKREKRQDAKSAKKEAKKEVEKSKKPKKVKKKPGLFRRIITTLLLIIVLGIIGVVVWVLVWGNDIIVKLTGGNSDIWSAIGTLTSENYIDLKTDGKGRTNILVFGTSGYDMNGSVGKKHHDGSQLTDSMMVVSLDQVTGDIVMASLPRDLKVGTCTATGKINEVYWCNSKKGEDAAAHALMGSVSNILGLDFQYYAHINWGSLIKIVDSIGGITVTLDEDVNDRNYTKTVIKAGVPTNLNGEQALGLARARHGTAGGDFSRGTSQQKILIAIKDKISSMMEKGEFGLTNALGLVSALGDNLRTNISLDEIKTAAHLAESVDFEQMRQVVLYNYKEPAKSYMKTANINNISYVVPKAGVGNYSQVQALIAKEFESDPIKREAAKILVLNGSGEDGLAGAERQSLESEGYNVVQIGNAPEGDYEDRYYIYRMNQNGIGTTKILRGLYNTEIRPASELPKGIDASSYDIVIIIGKRLKNDKD